MAALRNSLGRHAPSSAAERSGQLEGADAGLRALAGDVDDGDLEAVAVAGPGGDHEVAGERRAAGRAQRDLGVPVPAAAAAGC